uniref:Uncharacterized protein n=1 Tax=Rousettus aegyptiacus TaxID=9407 RepID=A0A7J8HRJ0_ROUAE|nr:hypothetical protein HJG63_011084 [Rousettus aegyptiacus]
MVWFPLCSVPAQHREKVDLEAIVGSRPPRAQAQGAVWGGPSARPFTVQFQSFLSHHQWAHSERGGQGFCRPRKGPEPRVGECGTIRPPSGLGSIPPQGPSLWDFLSSWAQPQVSSLTFYAMKYKPSKTTVNI